MVQHNDKLTIFAKKIVDMLVLTGREFRANQAKYFGAAQQGEDVIIKSRTGSFRIVPVKEDDVVISKDELSESLYKALVEAKEAGEGKRKLLNWEEMRNKLDTTLTIYK